MSVFQYFLTERSYCEKTPEDQQGSLCDTVRSQGREGEVGLSYRYLPLVDESDSLWIFCGDFISAVAAGRNPRLPAASDWYCPDSSFTLDGELFFSGSPVDNLKNVKIVDPIKSNTEHQLIRDNTHNSKRYLLIIQN